MNNSNKRSKITKAIIEAITTIVTHDFDCSQSPIFPWDFRD